MLQHKCGLALAMKHLKRKWLQRFLLSVIVTQDIIGTGYLSAFPSDFFERVEGLKPVWAPYYTIHKIMAGLLDQYLFANDTRALRMVTWMADYFTKRVKNVILKVHC